MLLYILVTSYTYHIKFKFPNFIHYNFLQVLDVSISKKPTSPRRTLPPAFKTLFYTVEDLKA